MNSFCILASLSFVLGQPTNRLPEKQCGPACLYLIAKSLGQDHSLADCSLLCHATGGNGTSLAELHEAAQTLGWCPILAELPSVLLADISPPAIVFLPRKNSDIGHYVVHWGGGGSARVIDPAGLHWHVNATQIPSKTLAVVIICPTWTEALACRLHLLYLQSPWRMVAFVMAAVLGIFFAYIGMASILARAVQRWLRTSRVVVVLAFMIMPALGCGSAKQSDELSNGNDPAAPRLVTDQGYSDLGTLRIGESARRILTFKNQSNQKVDIESVQSSCICVSARLLGSKTLLPRQQGEIEATIEGDSNGGRTAAIRLVGEQHRTFLTFTIQFDVALEWCTDRRVVRVDKLPPNINNKFMVRVNLDHGTDVRLAAKKMRVVGPPPEPLVEVVSVSGRESGKAQSLLLGITVNTGSRTDIGREQNIVLTIPDAAGVDHNVPIKLAWTYHAPPSFHPPEVVLLVRKETVIGPTEVTITSTSTAPISRVIGFSGVLDANVALVRTVEDRSVYRSQLRFIGDTGKEAVFKGFVTYYSGSEEHPLLSVPFRVRVEP